MEGKNEAITKLNKMKPRLATINLDWLDAELLSAETKYLEIPFMRENDLSNAFMKLSTLTVVRSKCQPIEEEKEPELPNYCVVKNKEYCFLSGKCKECSPQIGESFLSKTCTNNWEDKKFCENNGKCELCKIKQ